MKKQLLTIVITVAVMALVSFRIAEHESMAKVKTVEGIEIYMQSEPLRTYTVVGDVLPSGSNLHMDSMDHFCEFYIQRAKKKGYEFDALIFNNKWRGYAVKWKEGSTEKVSEKGSD
jgi:hypothetical protein